MSEPTQYDLVQDSRLDTVEGLVQTTYQPFQGPEFSYPVVHQPMDDEMWQYVTLGMGSGVLDVGGQPYHLRDLSDVTDTGKLTVSTTTGTAQALLRGFYHRLNADMTLNFPPVSQKTIYQVVLEYDPLRHKEPGGPIRVRVLTTLDWSGGKNYIVLWKLERDPSQLLSKAAVQYIHPKITPVINVDARAALPEPGSQLWGTRCLVRTTGEEVIAVGHGDTGPARWDTIQPAKAAGSVTVTMNNSVNGTASITFPTGRFESAPNIFMTKQGDSLAKAIPYVRSVTKTGAVVGLYTGDGARYNGSVTVAWRAYQP